MILITDYVISKKEEIKKKVSEAKKPLKMIIVQINDDPASEAYVKGKMKDLSEVGINYELLKLSKEISQDNLLKIMDKLNKDDSLTGYIVQLPLPPQIDEEVVKRSVAPSKDIDGFNPLSDFVPATPNGIITYLKDNNVELEGKNAVIIGRSEIVGKPMHQVLLKNNMNVTIIHSKTKEEDKKFYLEHADLIVVAVGKPYFLKKDQYELKKDAIVIDVGINRVDGHLVGDCEPDLGVAFQSPVPKGVGLLTRLALILNLMEASK